MVGGLFNGLIAPVIFNAIVEYQLAMVVACLLLPPLGLAATSRWSSLADLALAGLCLTIGVILIGLTVENLVFRNIEAATVRKWGMQN